MKRYYTALLILVGFALQAGLQAGSIKGSLTFTKKVPAAGLVYLGDDSGASAGEIIVKQKDKQFDQSLIFGAKGSTIVFKNDDTVQHNVFAEDKKQSISFDSGLSDPNADATQTIDWDSGVVVRVGCKIHPKMQIYVASIASSHASAIDLSGDGKEASFELSAPDNLNQLVIWLARYDTITVELKAGESKTVPITRKGKEYGQISLSR